MAEVERGADELACFICLEPCQSRSVCLCVNMPCHVACQRRFVEASQTNRCSVCKHAFTNVRIVHSVTCNVQWTVYLLLCCTTFLSSIVLFVTFTAIPMAWYLCLEASVCMCFGCLLLLLRPNVSLLRPRYVVVDEASR